jgi:hypothetical protein
VSQRAELKARRQELTRAFGVLGGGRGWRMHHVSVFTAHALYRYGDVLGHVVGDLGGRWWWSLQSQPKRLDGFREARDVDAACFALRQAVRRSFEGRAGT